MRSESFDAIIIGAGHNGLTCGALLAQAGMRVLVLEAREVIGGVAASEPIFPGYRVNTGSPGAALFRPEVVKSLFLERHGLQILDSAAEVFAPQPDGPGLILWTDAGRTVEALGKFSPPDASPYTRFREQVERMAGIVSAMMTLIPPELSVGAAPSAGELIPWGRLGLKIRGLGRREMMEFLRILPMPVRDYLDQWFENEAIKGVLAGQAVHGSMLGPMASGTTLAFLYACTGRQGPGFVRGGTGQLCETLAGVARQFRAEIRTDTPVARILIQDGAASGVQTQSGEEIRSHLVISAASPIRTYFDLVGSQHLPVRVVRRVRNMRFRGSTAVLHLALKGIPEFAGSPAGSEHLTGEIIVSPSPEYVERAYDDAKYGRISRDPVLRATIPTILDPDLAPPGHHLMSVTMQYAPYDLREANWSEAAASLETTIMESLCTYAPDLPELVQHKKLITPLELEQHYGLAEGHIYHGQMGLDQLLMMRPIPGWGRYRTPIQNMYLCGAGAHPGGGVTGAPGYNAARQILRDWR